MMLTGFLLLCAKLVSNLLADAMTIKHKTKLPYFRAYVCVSKLEELNNMIIIWVH